MTRIRCFIYAILAILSIGSAQANTIDSQIDSFFKSNLNWFADFIFTSVPVAGVQFPLIVGWLLIGALVFTLFFGFAQVRYFSLAINIVRGKYNDKLGAHSNSSGQLSHFQALSTALSGTVGLGNIAGVATALAIGGPGATFWMILAGFCGMASKFVECTLGVKYRNIDANGEVSGGAMYYLTKGLAARGLGNLGKVLAVGFAIATVFAALGAGNMFQANQTHAIMSSTFGVFQGQGWITGLILSALVFVVIVGGVNSIAKAATSIVPFMVVLYLLMCTWVLIANASLIDDAVGAIMHGAFTGAGVAGGIIGALIQGLKRATFSNEAGVGSAAIAHSAVRTNYPASEGMVALLEPFIDTVIICTMTALVITIAGLNLAPFGTAETLKGVELTRLSFQQTADWLQYPLAIAVALFAISTLFTWSYYGLKAWGYLLGNSKLSELTFKLLFCAFTVIGCSVTFEAVIDFSDAAFFTMAIFNMIGLYILMPEVKQEVQRLLTHLHSKAE